MWTVCSPLVCARLFFFLFLPSVAFAAPAVNVVVSPVQTESIADPLEALGTLKANESVVLTANVAETIRSIQFESGQRVKKGDVLVELDSSEEQAVLQEAKYTLNEAQSQLDRIKAVAKRGDASQSLLDEKQREFYVARARVAAIESRLENRLVRAPFSGVVGLRNVSLGAFVSPGDVITTLVDDRRMKLDFNVPSLFIASLKPGVAIQAKARALDNAVFDGVVESVDNQVDPISRSVTVRAILDNQQGQLKAGLLMEVELQSNPRDAIVISESALVQDRNQHFVFVVHQKEDGLHAQRRQVFIGTRLLGRVEIVKGLEPQEKVVVDGSLKLRDGAMVKVVEASPAISSNATGI